jgi:hypothetical protein
MPEDNDRFDYSGRLVFNGIYSTEFLTDEDSEVNREVLRERLAGRLYPYEEGKPGDPGNGYEEINLEEYAQQGVEEGRIESREAEVLLPIAQDAISQKYIKEKYDTKERVDEEGNSEQTTIRNRLTTYVFWDYPNHIFIKGAQQSAETTAADTRTALTPEVGEGEETLSSDGGAPGVRMNGMEFDQHFLLWLVYRDYTGESLANDIQIRRITDGKTEGGDEQDFFGRSNQVGESADIVRSTPFIEAVSQNKKPSMLEGIFTLHPFDLKAKVYDQGKVQLKAQEALGPTQSLRRILISLYFLRHFSELYEHWEDMDDSQRFVPPTFIQELHEIAKAEGIHIERSAEPIVTELLDRRGESLSDYSELDFTPDD